MIGAVNRRTVKLDSLDDVLREAERILSPGGKPRGGWTPTQNVEHVALTLRLSVDGYGDFRVKWFSRFVGPKLLGVFTKNTMEPGTVAPKQIAELIRPGDDTTPEAALTLL